MSETFTENERKNKQPLAISEDQTDSKPLLFAKEKMPTKEEYEMTEKVKYTSEINRKHIFRNTFQAVYIYRK